jgi:hypothetical protein
MEDYYNNRKDIITTERRKSQTNIAHQVMNLNPFPVIVDKYWVSFINTNKYSKSLWNCPYIPNIIKIYA